MYVNPSNYSELVFRMSELNKRLREMIGEDETLVGECIGGEMLEEYKKLIEQISDTLRKTQEDISLLTME